MIIKLETADRSPLIFSRLIYVMRINIYYWRRLLLVAVTIVVTLISAGTYRFIEVPGNMLGKKLLRTDTLTSSGSEKGKRQPGKSA
ncbi:hypothetical protein GCM10007171_35540 [Dickeya fangzhongdai]|nr:hypothetical protein GCM10007171_35540 [Dickeya fangzhongdai]